MNDKKLETLDELFEKAQQKPEKHWLEDIHTNEDCWDKTDCPMLTEVFTWKDDNGYNEERVWVQGIEGLVSVKTKCLTFDRVDRRHEPGEPYHNSTWDIDVEMFVYKDYIYTISNEHIHDAQTFTCQIITRRPLTLD